MRQAIITRFALQISAPFGWVGIGHFKRSAHEQSCFPLVQLSRHPFAIDMAQDAITARFSEMIKLYLAQAHGFESLPMPSGTPYQQAVWQAISRIPLGDTVSYQQLAEQIGSGARAVANACGANPWPIIVPCHRVLASHGIGGFMQGQADGLRIKQWLLEHEGALWQ